MISKLTPEQEAKIPEYLEYWKNIGLTTETIDREKAKEAVDFLYTKIMRIEKPKEYIFLDSPMACQLFLNSSNQLSNQLWNQLGDQLGNQLGNQLWNQLENQLENQLRNQLRNQLWNQLWNQLENQLWNQLRNQLWNQLWNQLANQKMQFIYESKTNWVQEYYWHSSFLLNEIFPEKKKNFGLFLEYLEHSKHYHHIYLSPEVAVFSDFPKTISLNSKGRLDNSQGMALEYRDRYGFYAQNGITANSPLELELL